jgi:hypothetical protein
MTYWSSGFSWARAAGRASKKATAVAAINFILSKYKILSVLAKGT